MSLIFRLAGKLVLTLAVLLFVAGIAAVDRQPEVAEPALPDSGTAAIVADLARELQNFAQMPAGEVSWTVTQQQMDAGARMLNRFYPGIRVDTDLGAARVQARASVALDRLIPGLWTNVKLDVLPSETGPVLQNLRVGALPVPVGLALRLAELWGDRHVAPGFVESLLASVDRVETAPGAVTAHLSLSGSADDTVSRRIRDLLQRTAGLEDVGSVYEWLWYINKAASLGLLPDQGSVLPYVRFILTGNQVPGTSGQDIKSALMALSIYCGDPRLGSAFGMSPLAHTATLCDGTTLNGRVDLRRHFLVSAGLRAARSDETATGIGEMKELFDSNAGRSGFSFDDLAANAAGIRFGETVLATDPADFASLAERIGGEADILPSLDGLPSGLTDAEFSATYGDVSSAAYRNLMSEIADRIDRMRFYSGLSGPAD